MDIEPPFRDEVEPLDLEYAQQVAEAAIQLERVQQMLPLIPDALKKVVHTQPDSFLFGMTTMGQALHDLLGRGILNEIAELLEDHQDNKEAMDIASQTVSLIAMMEALGYIACVEITNRAKQQ